MSTQTASRKTNRVSILSSGENVYPIAFFSYVAHADLPRKKKSGPLFEFNFLGRLAIILAFLIHLLVGLLV